MQETFPVVILIGRPAAGKSEVIDFLKHLPSVERRLRFHLGELVEIDDFVWVWQIFEDDDIRQQFGRERQNTTPDLYFKDAFTWDFLIGKINLEFAKSIAREPGLPNDKTVLVEFARGGENSFEHALSLLSDDILTSAVIIYVNVSFDESLRRNRKRARQGQEDSILYHSLPDAKMERYYRTNDWDRLSAGQSKGSIKVKNFSIPFAVFQNEPEVTDDPIKLGPALENAFRALWAMKNPAD